MWSIITISLLVSTCRGNALNRNAHPVLYTMAQLFFPEGSFDLDGAPALQALNDNSVMEPNTPDKNFKRDETAGISVKQNMFKQLVNTSGKPSDEEKPTGGLLPVPAGRRFLPPAKEESKKPLMDIDVSQFKLPDEFDPETDRDVIMPAGDHPAAPSGSRVLKRAIAVPEWLDTKPLKTSILAKICNWIKEWIERFKAALLKIFNTNKEKLYESANGAIADFLGLAEQFAKDSLYFGSKLAAEAMLDVDVKKTMESEAQNAMVTLKDVWHGVKNWLPTATQKSLVIN